MPFYTTPISQLKTSDLQELIDEKAVENIRLEFTQKDESKNETLKKLSSFANSFGGYLVIGGKAAGKDGRLQELPGVDAIPGLKQRTVQWCTEGASPPLMIEVSDAIPAPQDDGKVCYVAYAPESDIAPHFLNGRNGFWIRSDEFSFKPQLANDRELRQLLNRRQLIHEHRENLIARAKERFNTYLNQKHADRGGQRTKVGPLFELCIAPRFPSRQLRSHAELNEAIQRTVTRYRTSLFPQDPQGPLFQHESIIVLDPTEEDTSFFEANVWGALLYASTINPPNVESPAIHTRMFIGLVLLFVTHASKLLHELGYRGAVKVNCTVRPLRNTPWLYGPDGWPTPKQGSLLDEGFAFSVDTTTDHMFQTSDAVALDVLARVFYSVNWPMLAHPANAEKVLVLGKRYNQWTNQIV